MKKFLTVLLVIAVMFTFSFGSAFAATAVPGATATTHDEKVAEAVTKLTKEIDTLVAAAKKALAEEYNVTEVSDSWAIKAIVDGDVYAATIDQMAADYKAALAVAAQIVGADETIVDVYTAIKETPVVKAVLYAGTQEETLQVEWFLGHTAATLVDYVTVADTTTNPIQEYYMVYTYANALAGLKADVKAELAKVDMDAYTNDVIDPEDPYKVTYAQAAAKIMADLDEVIADTEVKMTMTAVEAHKAVKDMFDAVRAAVKVSDYITLIDGTTKVATEYLLNDVEMKTSEDLEADKANTEANKATLKAEIAKQAAAAYADALATYNSSDKKDAAKATFELYKGWIEAFKEVNNLLVDEEEITTIAFVNGPTSKDRTNAYEAAEKVAALCKIQVEKEGSAKYDAAEIDELLADLQVEIYAGRKVTVTAADFADALVAVDTFEWNKAHIICEVEDAMEDELYDACGNAVYYAPEQAKVEAKYAEKIAKIEAAANQDQLDAITLAVTHTIKTKAEVRDVVAGHLNTKKFAEAVEMYVQFMNKSAGVAPYADAYRSETVAYTADSAVVKYLAGEGARTNADVAAYLNQAEAFAQTIKTNGEIKAAKAAANEAIKALPTYITLADKDAVKAAWELADAAGVESAKLDAAVEAVRKAEVKAIDDMVKALPKKLTAANDADVKAIYAAVNAYEADEMYCVAGVHADYNTTEVAKAAQAVKDAWLADVHAAIAAVDAADEASVVAAREAVDGYVARYNSVCAPYRAVAFIQNMDKLTYAEAQVALAKIEAVEALKITASSKATKGAITVKWTVKGDDSAVEGYEIWKSTKKNSGFKKAFTATKMSYKNTKGLKKGTRYYYKVRAIAYVGAEKITSDWSNKAYRVAK